MARIFHGNKKMLPLSWNFELYDQQLSMLLLSAKAESKLRYSILTLALVELITE